MTTATAAPPRAAQSREPPPRRLSLDDVLRMVEAGILGETERVELLDGRLIEMNAEGVGHALSVEVATTRLARLYPEGFWVRAQSTLPIGKRSFVEPDVLVRREGGPGWPTPETVVLIIEVAQTSVAWDRGGKAALYAAWGAREYWVLDLMRRELVIHTQPRGDRYGMIRIVVAGEVEPPGAGGRLRLEELLPPADTSA